MAEKTEKKSGGGQIIKLALVLFAVSAIMALALGLIYEVTKDRRRADRLRRRDHVLRRTGHDHHGRRSRQRL